MPPVSAKDKALKHLKSLRERGEVSLPDVLLDTLAMSAVYPATLAQTPVSMQSVDDGWFAELEARLFTLLTDVSLANDRWVADAIYDADPKAAEAKVGGAVSARSRCPTRTRSTPRSSTTATSHI